MEFSFINGVKPGQFHCVITKDNTNTVPDSNGCYLWVGCDPNPSMIVVQSIDGKNITQGSKVIMSLKGNNPFSIAPVPANNTLSLDWNCVLYISETDEQPAVFDVVSKNDNSIQLKYQDRKFTIKKYPSSDCQYLFMAIPPNYYDNATFDVFMLRNTVDTITLSN